MVLVAAAPGLDANVGDAGILGRKVLREHRQFADGFEGGLARSRLAKDAAVGALPVEREGRPVALGADKLEAAITIGALCDVRIQVKKFKDVPAVTRHLLKLLRADCGGN